MRESITDHEEVFFDVSDGTSIVKCFDIDWNTGEFIVIARNEKGEDEHLQFDEVDTEKLFARLKNTTNSLYQEGRYIEFSEEELLKLQEDSPDTKKDK